MSWRSIIKYHIQKNSTAFDIYEFGVFTGDSLEFLIKDFQSFNIPLKTVFGFDSFEGIPEEKLDINNREEWQKGFCSAAKSLNCTKEQAIRYVEERTSPLHPHICLIPGFWDEVLKPEIVQRYNMKQALLIDIDCDIYSSAILALDFMFSNNLVVPGSLIGYDDWGTEPPIEFTTGESKAHREIEQKYNVDFEQLYKYGRTPHVQTLFRVKKYG